MDTGNPIASAGRRLRASVRPRTRWREARERRIRRRLAGPKLVAAFGVAYPEAFFIEIGANDGEQHDHLSPMIRTRPWRGIMVEPVPYVFERLRRNFADLERVALENAAIADHDGQLPFYHLAEAEKDDTALPEWYDAIGSFSRDAVLEHSDHIPDIENRLVETQVRSLKFETLCRRHGVDEIDLLVIDTEGYDYEIIKRIDLRRWRPRLLVYEHFHLSVADRRSCRAELEEQGYLTMAEGFDTWCLRAADTDGLTRVWRGLKPGVPELSADSGLA